ncbi:MAG: metalloregulator ArsR/SmtB family transcription factor [Pseudonocardiaceae bacterium]|nr:metalloregulator ArsR/SmtB family transcription factor [Pseudonocardiaceae bacterium]
MEIDAGKHALYEQFARIGKTLGTPLRLVLLDLLAQTERSVDDLAATAQATVGNTSAQLQALRQAGLVATRREGNRIYYRLAGDDVLSLLTTLTRVAEQHNAEAERAAGAYLGDLDSLEPIGREELVHRLDTAQAVLVDVRPEAEYTAGHLPGARSIPIDELAARLDELPAETEIVAYCRGPYCVYAPQAARLLRQHGRAARPLHGGWADWTLAGLPTEATPQPN